MKTLTKTELLADTERYFGIEITSMILHNNIAKGLIKRIDHFHEKGTSGSIAIFPKNSPCLFYLVKICVSKGLRLKDIAEYLRLLEKLDHEAIREIKNIIEEDKRYREGILFNEGITAKTKDFILENVPLQVLRLKNLTITRKEKLFKIISLRAHAELDYKEISNTIVRNSKDLKEFNKIQEILDSPIIDINIENVEEAFISVRYDEPFKNHVLFK